MTQPEHTGRVRVTSPLTSAPAHVRRSVRQEIDESTGIGEIYMQSLIRSQLRAALTVALTLMLSVGALPLTFMAFDTVTEFEVLGVPAPWLILGVRDGRPRHEPGDACELDGDLVVGDGGCPLAVGARAADALAQPLLADGLEQVVDGVHLEGLDGVGLVRRHEDDARGVAEPAQQPGDVEAAEPGHRDVEEHHVDAALLEQAQRLGAAVRAPDGRDAVVALQQPHQLVEHGLLVVDDEGVQRGGHASILAERDAGHKSRGGQSVATSTSGENLGTRSVTFVPKQGAVSTTMPYALP